MIVALIIAIFLIVGILFIYSFDEKKDFTVVVSLALIAIFVMGTSFGEKCPKSSKKKITPKIRVECEDNKCDTTYIYE